MKTLILITLVFLVTMFPRVVEAAPLMAGHECTSKEKWRWNQQIEKKTRNQAKLFLTRKRSALWSFSQAMAAKKNAVSQTEIVFSEYWISRSLYEAGLLHIALRGFEAIASRPANHDVVGIQAAAISCITLIHDRYPSLELSDTIVQNHRAVLSSIPKKKAFLKDRFTLLIFMQQLSRGARDAELKRTTQLFRKSTGYRELAQGLTALRAGQDTAASKNFARFFSIKRKDPYLKRHYQYAIMSHARALYASGKFAQAARQYQKIDRNSNLIVEGISELSWAHLQNGQPQRAIGSALSLQRGDLRKTFAPTGLAIIGISLNELCQYPKAIQAVRQINRNYRAPFLWLKKNRSQRQLYPLVTQALQNSKKSKIPSAVSTRWLGSPGFIARQDEINLLFQEADDALASEKNVRTDYNLLIENTLQFVVELKEDLKNAQSKDRKKVRAKIKQLSSLLDEFQALQAAAPYWKRIKTVNTQMAKVRQDQLIVGINRDLYALNGQMLAEMEETIETAQLIEVEILNGASKDMIWRNAYPDYQKVVKQLHAEDNQKRAEKVWSWGKVDYRFDQSTEIWEDELGSFQADLTDNCSNKERYLALKIQRSSR